MRLGTMFYYTLIQNWRDRSTYLEMLFLPILLIFILGISLGNAFQSPFISDTEVAYFNEDKGPIGESFEMFMRHEESTDLLSLTPVISADEGIQLVEEGQVHAFIHVPADLLQGETVKLQLIGSHQHNFRFTIVESMLESFVSGVNMVLAMEEINPDSLLMVRENSIEARSLQASDVRPGAMDYYAVTMLVMFMMYGTTYAVFGMKHAYLNTTGHRIRTTPIRPIEHYLGLVLANMLTVLIQGIILVTFTRFVFGVNWGNNLPLLFLILLLTGIMAIGLGTAIVMVTGNETLSGNIVMVLVPVMTFLAGGFFRLGLPDSSFLYYLQYLSPNYLAQTALFNTIYAGDFQRTLSMMLIMMVIILISFTMALVSERRFQT